MVVIGSEVLLGIKVPLHQCRSSLNQVQI